MEPITIMSAEFKEVLTKEIEVMEEVISNYRSDENNFGLDAYIEYANALLELKGWTFLE